MLLLNFSHQLTDAQCRQIAELADMSIEEVHTIHVRIHQKGPLEPQIVSIVDSAGLSSQEWQTRPILINPPGYAPAAFVLRAELHGRIGHFPTLIRLRPKDGPIRSYKVAGLLNLQTIQEAARRRR